MGKTLRVKMLRNYTHYQKGKEYAMPESIAHIMVRQHNAEILENQPVYVAPVIVEIPDTIPIVDEDVNIDATDNPQDNDAVLVTKRGSKKNNVPKTPGDDTTE